MNNKAKNFQAYLDEKKITCFQAQEAKGDKFNAAVFRSSLSVKGQLLPVGVILDDSIYGIIRVQIAPSVQNKEKLLAHLDELNARYKSFKYHTNASGVYLDVCVMGAAEAFRKEEDGNLIIALADSIVKHLETEYPQIMSLLWSK